MGQPAFGGVHPGLAATGPAISLCRKVEGNELKCENELRSQKADTKGMLLIFFFSLETAHSADGTELSAERWACSPEPTS